MRLLRTTIGRHNALLFLVIAMLACCSAAGAADLKDFTSDGCSLFPDGTLADRGKWCECCLRHDIVYWHGGTEQERRMADEDLRTCVFERTGDKTLAETMYVGVRVGGHPAFPTWYRWGYGWKYGRGYKPLTGQEQQLVREKQADYVRTHPAGYCGERSRKNLSKERKEQ